LWFYNAGVHFISKEKEEVYFQIWTEGEGKRGTNDVCSSLLTFVGVSNITSSDLQNWLRGAIHVEVKTRTFLWYAFGSMWSSVSGSLTEHKFPEPGHTYLDSDIEISIWLTSVPVNHDKLC